MQRSFGPSAALNETTGEITTSCVSSQTYCFLLHGRKCGDQKPPREIEDTKATPDWCQYRAGIIEDVRAAIDYRRMGLDRLTRAELMPLMKDVPDEFRAQDSTRGKPFRLTEHNADMMRYAIRKARLAAEAAPCART